MRREGAEVLGVQQFRERREVRLQRLGEAGAVGATVDAQARGERHARGADDVSLDRQTAAQQVILEFPLHARQLAHEAPAAIFLACGRARGALARQGALAQCAGVVQLRTQFREWRNMVVALDHGRHGAEAAHGGGVQLPHRVRHRMIVRVDEVVAAILVTGEMDLLHAVGGNGVQVFERLEFVVNGSSHRYC